MAPVAVCCVSQLLARAAPVVYTKRVCAEGLHFNAFSLLLLFLGECSYAGKLMAAPHLKYFSWIIFSPTMLIFIGCLLLLQLFLPHVPVAWMKLAGEEQLGDINHHNSQQYCNSMLGHGQPCHNSTLERGQQCHGPGHMMVLQFSQQMMGSFVAFYHLANITSMLNLTSVEPFVTSEGKMAGAPHVDSFSDPQVVKLSHFFDLDHLKGAIKSCVNGNLVTFDTFIEEASREVVLVKALYSLDKYKNHFKNGVKAVEVNENASGYLKNLNKWVEWGAKEKGWNSRVFRVSRVLLIDVRPQHPFPLDKLLKELNKVICEQVAVHGSATLIIDYWRDIERSDGVSTNFCRIPGYVWTHCYDFETAAFSQSVVGAAQKFRESLNETCPVVGVQIRGELLLRNFNGSQSQHMKCLTELGKLINSGSVSNLISNGSLYIFHDLGKYGTKTCSNNPLCKNRKKQFVDAIKNLGHRIAYYDSSEFRPKGLQSVFSALVEMEYLSKVDVLITVGRGQFQNKIIERFMKHKGHDGNLTRICSQGGFKLPPPQSKLDLKN